MAVAAILLAGGLASHQAGKLDVFSVRRTLAIVNADVGFRFVSPTDVDWPEHTFAVPPQLFEDGKPLGPGDSRPKEIRELGMGRYRFLGNSLYFSSSDGSDPRLNGRRYTFDGPRCLSRGTAVLAYLLLGMLAASALRPWLSSPISLCLTESGQLLRELTNPEHSTGQVAPRDVVNGLAEWDATPLQRWESRLVVALASCLAVAVATWFLASPNLASIMLEYATKSVPLFVDGSASSILDFNGAGDPRGRLVNSFFTWVNIHARRELFLTTAIHPALSINWLLYPLTLAVLNRAIRRTSRGPRYAIIVTLLYAASPGMLDTLVDYHLPGKALMNFWFAAALYGAALCVPAEHEGRPGLGALILGATTFLALLSDETAVFIPVCVCLLFGQQILVRPNARRSTLLVAAGFGAALVAYAVVVLVAVPLANAALQQAPLDLPSIVLKGPFAAMFGEQPRAIGGMLKYYGPVSVLHAIVSAHLVPGRVVTVSWTNHLPYPRFWRWSVSEQLALYGVLIVIAVLARLLPAARKPPIWRISLTFLVYVAVQSVLQVALSGYVWESSYYAALASVLLALLVGAIAAASGRSPGMRALSWALVAYVAAVELTNMVGTARHHPYLGADLTWQDLKTIQTRIARGEVVQTLAAQPFPSRRFFYAFEAAAAFESAERRRIDFRPMLEPQEGLVRLLDIDRVAEPGMSRMGGPSPRSDTPIDTVRRDEPIDPRFFRAGTVRGETGAWSYRWRFDGTGKVVQRSWRYGLMRLWYATGRVERRGRDVCLVFHAPTSTCFASLHERDGWIIAFAADGRLVTRFKWES